MHATETVSGLALTGESFEPEPVDIIIENGTITALEHNPRAPNVWIIPAFFNAHTHLADTVAMDCPAQGDLAALVTPPDGLKHRILAATGTDDLVRAMRASIGEMVRGGTCGCADFREGGRAGVAALKEACTGIPFSPLIFGRDGGEEIADGLGISSTRDVAGVETLVQRAKQQGKKIAFHAGERDSRDIDAALSFGPDLLIHMTHATRKQIRACADEGIPIAVCPRSNWVLGVTASDRHPPVSMMQDAGCTVLLGTDNVMFVPPDMPAEMAFLHTVYHTGPAEALRAAVRGRELTGQSAFIEKGARAAFFSLDPAQSPLGFSRDPLTSIVRRLSGSLCRDKRYNC